MKWSVLFVILACGAPAQAQPPMALSLSLDEAIARGLAASHRVAEAGARADAAEAAVGQRHAAALPQVQALAGYMRTNNVPEFGVPTPGGQINVIYPNVPDNYRLRLDAGWTLYNAGRTTALEEAARQDARASTSDVEALRTDLRFEITRAFWALFVAEEAGRVVNEALARTTAHVANVRNALSAGLVPPNDVLTAEAQESRQRMLSINAGSAREVAELELARLVGLPAGTAIHAAESLAVPATGTDPTLLQLQAREGRDDRHALALRIAAAQSREEAALAARRPTVSVNGGFDYARPNPRIFPRRAAWQDSWDASVNVSVPLFNGGRTSAEIAEATAARRALDARLAELDTVVAFDVRQRLADLRATDAAIAAAEDGVRAATEALRVVNDRYAAGVAISTDVLDAQVVLLQASLDRTQAMVNARLTVARLTRALGE